MRWDDLLHDTPLWLGLGGAPTPQLRPAPREALPHSYHVRPWVRGDPPRVPGELTVLEVVELRTRAAAGETDRELSDAYGLDVCAVGQVRRGEVRMDAGGPESIRHRGSSWTPERCAEARARAIARRGVARK